MRVLDNFIIKLKKDTQASLSKQERIKSAKYGSSNNGNSRLWGTIKTKSTGNSASMLMQDYWKYVNFGRNPGGVSQSGRLNIEDWVKRKGLNPSKIIDDMRAKKLGRQPTKRTPFQQAKKQLAFIVSRKIKVKGYDGNEFYSDVINDGRLDDLNKDIGKEIKLDIVNIFNGKAGK